ncbi:hypothetical protein GOBAR_DD31976 [Gossypium barbadense]|nr:hypothetical protein GOBAR_DD31976 [Gossypium barbadense]
MTVNAREDDGDKIQNNALLYVSSSTPSLSRKVLGTEAWDALMEMVRHVIGQWFDRYIGDVPTSSHRCHDEHGERRGDGKDNSCCTASVS